MFLFSGSYPSEATLVKNLTSVFTNYDYYVTREIWAYSSVLETLVFVEGLSVADFAQLIYVADVALPTFSPITRPTFAPSQVPVASAPFTSAPTMHPSLKPTISPTPVNLLDAAYVKSQLISTIQRSMDQQSTCTDLVLSTLNHTLINGQCQLECSTIEAPTGREIYFGSCLFWQQLQYPLKMSAFTALVVSSIFGVLIILQNAMGFKHKCLLLRIGRARFETDPEQMPASLMSRLLGCYLSCIVYGMVIVIVVVFSIVFLLWWKPSQEGIWQYKNYWISWILPSIALMLWQGQLWSIAVEGGIIKDGQRFTFLNLALLFSYLTLASLQALLRVIYLMAFMISCIMRMDFTLFPKGIKSMDSPHNAMLATILVHGRSTNPIARLFVHFLIKGKEDRKAESAADRDGKSGPTKLTADNNIPFSPSIPSIPSISPSPPSPSPQSVASVGVDAHLVDNSSGKDLSAKRLSPEASMRARTRWHLMVMLTRNPFLIRLRKSKTQVAVDEAKDGMLSMVINVLSGKRGQKSPDADGDRKRHDQDHHIDQSQRCDDSANDDCSHKPHSSATADDSDHDDGGPDRDPSIREVHDTSLSFCEGVNPLLLDGAIVRKLSKSPSVVSGSSSYGINVGFNDEFKDSAIELSTAASSSIQEENHSDGDGERRNLRAHLGWDL